MSTENIVQEMHAVIAERSRALRQCERKLAALAEQLVAAEKSETEGVPVRPPRRWQDDALRFLLTKNQPVMLEALNLYLAKLGYEISGEAVSVGLTRLKRTGLVANSEDDVSLARGEWKLTAKGQKAARKLTAPK